VENKTVLWKDYCLKKFLQPPMISAQYSEAFCMSKLSLASM
jgi:hypothetical protein